MTETLPANSEEEREDEYALDPELVAAVMESVDAADRVGVLALVADLHVADLADLTEQIDSEHRRRFIGLVWADIDQEILIELQEGVTELPGQVYSVAFPIEKVVTDLNKTRCSSVTATEDRDRIYDLE